MGTEEFGPKKWSEAIETAMRGNVAPGVVGDALKNAMRREWCGDALTDGVEWAISAAAVGIECLTPGDGLATADDIRGYLSWQEGLEVDELRNCFDSADFSDDDELDYSTATLMLTDDTRSVAYFLFDSVIPEMGMWDSFVEFCDLNEIDVPEYLHPCGM